MTGLKMTTVTNEEMSAARENGKSLSDWARVHRMIENDIEPAEDDDSPNAAALMRADLEKRRIGRPLGQDNKVQVSIRYHREVIDYFKAKGAGWQVQMDKVLLDWVKTRSAKQE